MSQPLRRSWTDPELWAAAVPITLVQTALFLVPLLIAVVLSFQTTQFFQVVWSWDFQTWSDVFSRPHYWIVIVRTTAYAALTTLLCLLIAFPFAYALATRLRHIENHIKFLVIFAFLTDAVLKTYGWVLVLDTRGLINFTLERIGLDLEGMSILYTPAAIVLGMVYNLLPFMIFTVYLAVLGIDRALIDAAYDAGASKLRAFWEVTLPLCRPGIWAGCVLVFVLSLGVFLEPQILGGGMTTFSASLVRQTFETRVNWPLGAALTVAVVATAAFVVLLFTRLYGLRRGMG